MFKSWSVRDENGNLVHYRNSLGEEMRATYNRQGLRTYYETNAGYKEWFVWDEFGNLLFWKNSDGALFGQQWES